MNMPLLVRNFRAWVRRKILGSSSEHLRHDKKHVALKGKELAQRGFCQEMRFVCVTLGIFEIYMILHLSSYRREAIPLVLVHQR